MPSLGLLYGVELIHRGNAVPAADGLPRFGHLLTRVEHGAQFETRVEHGAHLETQLEGQGG